MIEEIMLTANQLLFSYEKELLEKGKQNINLIKLKMKEK